MKPQFRAIAFVLVVVVLLSTLIGPCASGSAARCWVWLLLAPIALTLRPFTFVRHLACKGSVSVITRFLDVIVAGVLFSAAANGLILPLRVTR
jgi:hypothetical protein